MPVRNPRQSGHLTRLDTRLETFAGTSLFNPGSEAASGITYVLDSYVAAGGAAPYAARSVSHQLSSTYTGPLIRVRNATTTVETDIGYVAGTGLRNETEMSDALSGADGTVVTVYDQSGNAYDVTNATPANQPKIWDSVTGALAVGSLMSASCAPLNQGDAGDGWARGDYSGFTGGTNPALTLATWFKFGNGHLVASHVSKIGNSGVVVQLAVRIATPTLSASGGPTIPNGAYRDFTPAETLTNGGYVVMSKGLNANLSAATMRQNGIALSQAAVVAGVPSLAGNLTATAGQALAFNSVMSWNNEIWIPEVSSGAALTALEDFFETLNTLAGV